MGADVIKVEPPKGDMGRAMPPIRNGESVSFTALNRNKRSLVLDLKQPAAQRDHAQARGASPTCSSKPTGRARWRRWASAPQHLKAVNPKIVYTSVSGFGQTGPDRRRAGVNLIIEAFSGALSVTGEPGKMPMRPGVQTADVFGALFATYATLASLVGAARNGEGRIADVSLVEASIAAAAWEAAEYLKPARSRSRSATSTGSTRPISCSRRATSAISRSARRTTCCSRSSCRCSGSTRTSPIRASPPMPTARPTRTPLVALVEPAVRTMKSVELEAALVEAGIPCARVNNFKEVFDDPHIVARGVVGRSSIRGSAR